MLGTLGVFVSTQTANSDRSDSNTTNTKRDVAKIPIAMNITPRKPGLPATSFLAKRPWVVYEAGGNPSLGRREPSKGLEDSGRTRRDFGGGGIAAVWRKHDGAAGVARSASHAHCLGVDNDLA